MRLFSPDESASTSRSPDLRAARQRAGAESSRAVSRRGGRVSAEARRGEAGRAADLERRRHHGHEDLHVLSRHVSHRPELRRQEQTAPAIGKRRRTCSSCVTTSTSSARISKSKRTPIAAPRSPTARAIAGSTSKTTKIASFKGSIQNGWIAALQHHFVAAAVPPAPETAQYQLGLNARNDFTLSYHRTDQGRAGRRDAGLQGAVVRRTEAAGSIEGDWRRCSITSPTTAGSRPIAQPLFWLLEKVLRPGAQLGLGDHHRHVPDQARVLQADRRERPLDGEDAQRRAAHQGDPGALQGRPRAARPPDDGAVQAREDQSARRLPADPDPDPVLLRVLPRAARERRDAAGAVPRLDQRSSARAIRSSSCRS